MRILIVTAALALSACSLTPGYHRPNTDLPSVYPMVKAHEPQLKITGVSWQQMFPDPTLQKIVGQALQNNHDLRLAILNIESLRAQYGIQKADQLPAINGNVSATRARSLSSYPTKDPTYLGSDYGVTVGLNAYELDLFGRVRSLSDAALKRYLASEQGMKAARISLIASVADAYYSVLFAKEQSQLAEKTLADWQRSLDLARQLHQADQNSALDVAQAESQVATAEADLEARRRGSIQAVNALALLVGRSVAGDLPAGITDGHPLMSVPVGIPSEQLVKRPDIIQAELTLQAANADVGAARAAFFPRISLTASAGYSSTQLDGLFAGENKVWSFAPQISIPIFQAGKLQSELKLAEVRKSVAVVEYEKAIRTAFREVADGLAGRETYDRQIQAQQRVVMASNRRVNLSTLRYQAGVDGRLELLDSQREFYTAQQTLLDLKHNQITNMIGLYKSLAAE